MRLFIAVPISDQARQGAARIIQGLRESGADFKWVVSENLHLTLSFLGSLPGEKVPGVADAMSRVVFRRKEFEMILGSLGAFKSLEHPQVLWISILEGGAALAQLAESLGRELEARGLKPEAEKNRAFAAHLTIGRLRSSRNLERLKASLKSGMFSGDRMRTKVERIALYESRLSSAGPSYRELAEACLRE